MRIIQDSRITIKADGYSAVCVCGARVNFKTKGSCLKMLRRGTCRNCKRTYQKVTEAVNIYQNKDLKWCSVCSGCNAEQAYTRKDHAKQSTLADWQCKPCVAKAKGYSENKPIGDLPRIYNRFRKSANQRRIPWGLTLDTFMSTYTNKCALTGWDLSTELKSCTASLDRIDSNKGYYLDNIQWVHTMVNMCKNKYSQEVFVSMCVAIANKVKW